MSGPGGRLRTGGEVQDGRGTQNSWTQAADRRTELRGLAVDGVGALLATLVASAGLAATAGPAALARTAVVGALLGVGLGLIWSGRRPLLWLPPVAVILAVVVGPVAVGLLPTPDALIGAARGVVTSWKDLLTSTPPVDDDPESLYAVFFTVVITGLATTLAAGRFGRPAVAAGAAVLGLGVAVWLGSFEVVLPAVVGVALAVVLLAWSAARSLLGGADRSATGVTVTRRVRPARAAAGVVMVASAALAGVVVAPLGIDPDHRTLLRDRVEPPLDVRQFVSPLVGFRNYRGPLRSAELFTLDERPADGRLRLAALEDYDGVVFGSAGGRTGDSGVYERLSRARTRDGAWADLPRGPEDRVVVTVGEYGDVWTPGLASVETVTAVLGGDDDDATTTGGDAATGGPELAERDLYANPASGTLVTTTGLETGMRYEVAGRAGIDVADTGVADAPAADIALPPAENVPEVIATVAAEATAGETTAIGRARALESYLRANGYYSSGQRGEVSSRAGHNAHRMEILLESDQMIGDEEQYAVAMALMARSVGLPARVVVGFEVPEDGGDSVAVTGDMATVWVEIPFEDAGWVVFAPTPDRDKIPQQLAPEPKTSPQPKSIQPPPPPQETVELVSATSPGGADEELDRWAWLWAFLLDVLLLLGRTLLLGLLLLLLPAAVVLAKLRRTRARRGGNDPRGRVVGGWDDLVDTFVDLGAARSDGATRREVADRVAEAYPDLAVTALAGGADAGAFAPGDLAAEQAAGYWAEVERVRAELRAATPAVVWWRSRISLRSLIPEDRARALRSGGRGLLSGLTGRFRGLRRDKDREWIR